MNLEKKRALLLFLIRRNNRSSPTKKRTVSLLNALPIARKKNLIDIGKWKEKEIWNYVERWRRRVTTYSIQRWVDQLVNVFHFLLLIVNGTIESCAHGSQFTNKTRCVTTEERRAPLSFFRPLNGRQEQKSH